MLPTPNTSVSTRLPGLDHLRALAISLVFLFHYRIFPHPEWLTAMGKFGWTGVDLFFVLSGYLISAQLLQEIARRGRISLKTYFIKRTFRILPAYLAVVAIYFGIPAFREREALPPLWKFLTFTQNFGLDLAKGGTFSHAWSLCVEEQFYLLLPLALLGLLAVKVSRRATVLLPLLVGFGLVIRWLSWHYVLAPEVGSDQFGFDWYTWIYYPTYNRLDGLLVGIGIAALFHFRPQLAARLARQGNWLLVAGLAVLTGAYFLCLDAQTLAASVFGFPLVALGYGLLVAGAVSPGSVLDKAKSRISTKLAALSFAVYLTHKGIIHLVQTWFSGHGVGLESNAMMLLCLGFVLAGALLLNVVVERPFLRIRKRLLARPRPVSGLVVLEVGA